MTSLIRDRQTSSAEMLAVFSDEMLVRSALDFEQALARAQAAEELMAPREAEAIARVCDGLVIDMASLAAEAAHAGTLAIPLVRYLRSAVATIDEGAASKVHMGATSQDVADTALVLQAKAGLTLIDRDLTRMISALESLALSHRETPMLGRTLLQGAQPITLGLKTANWLTALDAALRRLRLESEAALLLQFGGPTGSLSGQQGRGIAVADRLAATLGLTAPVMPWHSRRDGIAGLGVALSILTGSVGKIARDIGLMAQPEIGEAFEPLIAGRGGSSAMAHKRNPTGCQVAISAALRSAGLAASLLSALPQEHERGLGGWQIDGPVIADLFGLAHSAVEAMVTVVIGLEIDTSRMLSNLAAAAVGSDFGEAPLLVDRAVQWRKAIT